MYALAGRDGHGDDSPRWLWFVCPVTPEPLAPELWDDEIWHELATRAVGLARDAGALAILPNALTYRASLHVLAGEFAAGSALIEEAYGIAEATGSAPLRYPSLLLAAWRGRESAALETIEAGIQDARARGLDRAVGFAQWVTAVLYNGLGRYEDALSAAQRACAHEDLGFFGFALSELVEAAARTDRREVASDALGQLEERTRASGTDWALGIEARSRALLSDGDTAERLYLEAIGRLGRTRIRVELARAHLLCGEWLRRERWRLDAREQLRAAHEMFTGMGAAAFADRAALALLATAGRARKRTVETPGRPDPAGGSDRAAGPRGALQTRDRRAAVHQPVHRRIPPPQGLQQARHQLAKPTRPCPARATKRGRVVRAGSAVKWGSLRPCGTSVAVP
jgi:hypothetical protein